LTKLVAKYIEGIFPLCLVGEEWNTKLEKPLWGWSNSLALVGKAKHCTAL
jgi:hypothetical protein